MWKLLTTQSLFILYNSHQQVQLQPRNVLKCVIQVRLRSLHCLRKCSLCFFHKTVVVQLLSCVWLCDPMDCSRPGSSVLHCLLEFAQTHCLSTWWCHLTTSSPATLFSSCLQSFPASGSFPMCQLFTSGGQGLGASASGSVLLMNVQGWLSLGLTGLISIRANICLFQGWLWVVIRKWALLKTKECIVTLMTILHIVLTVNQHLPVISLRASLLLQAGLSSRFPNRVVEPSPPCLFSRWRQEARGSKPTCKHLTVSQCSRRV